MVVSQDMSDFPPHSQRPVPLTCERTIAGLRTRLAEVRSQGRIVGLVPTMGSLHPGHLSLIDRASADGCFVVVSVFVNPLQFGPSEDFDDYPRDLDRDLQVCADAGTDLVFAPAQSEMYPEPPCTTVSVGRLAGILCGSSRPGHFDGVATVVAKLFSVVGECSAYFGRKDFQQLSVVKRMVADLSLPVRVVGCPTVRESDGLAMSSRNVYLSEAERAQAPVLRSALDAGIAYVESGERDPAKIQAVMEDVLASAPLADIDYAVAVPASCLISSRPLEGEVRLLVAARFGRTRLIDNAGCAVP